MFGDNGTKTQAVDLEGVILIEEYFTISQAKIKFATEQQPSKKIEEILKYAIKNNLIKYKKGKNQTSPNEISQTQIENYLKTKLEAQPNPNLNLDELKNQLKNINQLNFSLVESLSLAQAQNDKLLRLLESKEITLQNQQSLTLAQTRVNFLEKEIEIIPNWLLAFFNLFRRKKTKNDN